MYYSICKTGRYHQRQGLSCQDHVFCDEIEEDLYIMIVADGCGSSKYGGEAAKIAVNQASEFISQYRIPTQYRSAEMLKSLCMTALFHSAISLENEVKKRNSLVDDFSTTASIALVDKNSSTCTWAHCGDGAMWIKEKKGRYMKATKEIRPFGLSNFIYPLLDGCRYWTCGAAENVDAVMLCTDGFSPAIMPNRTFYEKCGLSGEYPYFWPMLELLMNRETLPKERNDTENLIHSILKDKQIAIDHIEKNFHAFTDEILPDTRVLIPELLENLQDDLSVAVVL